MSGKSSQTILGVIAKGSAALLLLASLLAPVIALPGLARAQLSDKFSWGDVRNHPYAVPGGVYEQLPDGNYLTPNKNQQQRCESGCVLYATVGTMEIQFKILQSDPRLTLDLSEGALLDVYDVQNYGLGTGRLCGGDCSRSSGVTSSTCIPDVLQVEGVPRAGVEDGIVYRIGAYELFDARTATFDQIRQRLLMGPIAATVRVDKTIHGQKYLWWSGPCEPGMSCPETVYHRLVIVGYSQTTTVSGAPADRWLQVKNSWGVSDHGFSDYTWVKWEHDCLYKDSPWLQISALTVSDTALDTDGDGIPNYRDLCPNVPSGRISEGKIFQPNLDGDAFGDECDPDMDGDGVLDIYDCHPWNRYLGYDLDRDGICDDPQRAVARAGAPYADLFANPLHTPAFKDYKDDWTIGTVNKDNAMEDGDSDLDLPLEAVCHNQCVRVASLPAILRPSGFSLSRCQALCDPTLQPRDNCTPMSAASSAGSSFNEWDACFLLRSCVTYKAGLGFCEPESVSQAAATCRRFWHNPAAGQMDSDGDGVGDFCDDELLVKNLSTRIETENYRMPGDLGIELAFVQCYKNEVDITFDTWGGRSRDGQTFGVSRDGVAISACICPKESWGASCAAYCPTDGEYPTSGDPLFNPGVGNAAWDPISSPQDCMSKRDIQEGLDHHLCQDRWLVFRGDGYEHSPRQRYSWRWRPFYDPDQQQGGRLMEHPSPRYDDDNPRLVKVRVSWPHAGMTPAADEKAFLPLAERLRAGCFWPKPELAESLQLRPSWIVPPSALHFAPAIPPGGLARDFENLLQPGAALALMGDHLVALDPASGAIISARSVSYASKARLRAGNVDGNAVALGTLAASEIPAALNTAALSRTATPVILHLNDGVLWLGLPVFHNTWIPWVEAYGEASLPPGEIAAVIGSEAGHLMLLVGETGSDGELVAYLAQGTTWAQVGSLSRQAIDPAVRGYRALLHPSGRQLYFVGGEGPGWNAVVHRWDLYSGRFQALDMPELSHWGNLRRTSLGVALVDEMLYLAGSELVRVDLLAERAEVLTSVMPEETGPSPFLSFDAQRTLLTMIPTGTGGKPSISALDLSVGRPDWDTRPMLDTEERSSGAASGSLRPGEIGRVVFAVTKERVRREQLVSLIASNPSVSLRVLDEHGSLVVVSEDNRTLRFTPAETDRFYVVEVVAPADLEPSMMVSYAIEISAAEEDRGCSCAVSSGGLIPGVFLFPTLLLLLFIRGYRRRNNVW